jgi:chondroitin AC lyase
MQSSIHKLFSGSLFHVRVAILFSVIVSVNLAMPASSPANQAEIDAMSAAAKNMYLPVGTSLDWEITNTILPLLSGGGNTFTDINYGGGDGWNQVQHLERAKKMAQAYQDPASAHYQDAALHDTILALLDYFINNWPYEPSWWWAAIGYPNNCNPVVMLMKDEIIASTAYPNLQSQTDNKLTSKSWDKRGNSGGGANDSDICTSALVAALLSDDYGYCTSVKNYCNPLFSLKTGYSDGLMSDSSFTQHNGNGRQFQLTSYGREYMGGFLELATMFKPSSLRFSDEVIGSFEDLYLSGVRHLIYHANGPGTHWQDPGYMDILQSGRGYPSGGWIDRGLAEFNMSYNIPEFLAYGAPRSKELQELQDIMTDVVQETVPANKMFWHQDMMTHQRPHYYTSARGTSTRTVGNEGRISEAAKSYHMGDGVNMVLHHGDEYDGVYAPWDWKRLPGTTIEQNGSALPANSTLLQWPGGQAHAGGVSDGTYGNYGFYFNEGGNNSKMEAYKSQFFFDDEYVCLGAGIDASGAGSDVVTTINQTMHKSDFVKGDGASTSTHGAGDSVTLGINQWAHHYDIGYLILDKDGTATASVDSQTGLKSDINGGTSYNPDSITENIFNLTINHGSGTYTGKKYAYVVVPGLSVSEMDAYAAAPGVEVLSNSTTVQAVHHAGLRLTSAHFYSAGSLTMKDGTILTTDKAVALLLKEEGSFLVISAADPKYQGTTTTITLNKELSGTGVTWNGSVSTIPITLAGGGHDNGKSV